MAEQDNTVFTIKPYWENTGGGMMVLLTELTESFAQKVGASGLAVTMGDECAGTYKSLEAFFDGDLEGEEYVCDSSDACKNQRGTKTLNSVDIAWDDLEHFKSTITLRFNSGYVFSLENGEFKVSLENDVEYEDIVVIR